jgi:hypothetical protein
VNYAKLLEMNSFFNLHTILEVGKSQDLPSKIWQTLGDALTLAMQNKGAFRTKLCQTAASRNSFPNESLRLLP